MMFASQLCLFLLLASSHQLSQLRTIYTEPKFMKLILESSSKKQLDLTACLAGMANGKFMECVATMVLDDKCDFYLFKRSPRRRRSKRRDVVPQQHCLLRTLLTGLLRYHAVNVVMMEWKRKGGYSKIPHSLVVLADVFGRKLVNLIQNLLKTGVSNANIHLVGVGVGAHITSFAGKYLKAKNETVSRITGLNPFGGIFDTQPAQFRIDKTDATFVDCIFTSSLEIAMRDPVCSANFYSNCYGKKQPGDDSIQSEDRATALFAESVIPYHKFRAKKCPDLLPCHGLNPKHCVNGIALMGYPASKKLTGIYYVKTGKQYPFSLVKSGKKDQQSVVVADWIKQFTGQPIRRLRRNLRSIHNYIMDELRLLKELISYGVKTGLTLSKCTVETIFGYKAALQCFIKHFMVKDCSFFLYTKEHPDTRRLLHLPFYRLKRQVKKLNINIHRKVLIVVHGVTSNYKIPWVQRLKDDMLANHNVNVILMDWRSKIDHLLMASYVGLIPLASCFAKKVAQFVTGMMRAGWKLSQFHLIGHSLGGQIVGLAGKELERSTKTSLPRISALDPAGFAFDMLSTHYRLDKHDAEFVDCIFTSAPIIAMRNPVCTANFYANCYGQHQPGSETTKIGGSTMISHMRAALLFAESAIPSHQFSAKQCSKLPCHGMIPQDCDDLNGTALMGYPASSEMKGIFYVKTRGTYPYALKIKKAE